MEHFVAGYEAAVVAAVVQRLLAFAQMYVVVEGCSVYEGFVGIRDSSHRHQSPSSACIAWTC